MRAHFIAAATALLAASGADALTYTGSLTAGSTTATYTIETDGTFGVLALANIVNVSGTITSASQTQSFTNSNFTQVGGSSTTASATQIFFDTSVSGYFVAGFSGGAFSLFCLTGSAGATCNGEAARAVFLAASYPSDYEFTTGNASYVLATIASVPEPATWSLMIGGFGLAGLGLRRRRSIGVTA